MARKHRVEAPDDGGMILPLHLITRERLGDDQLKACNIAQRQWFRDRGIDPGDWSKVYPILKASWAAHGIESALDRARKRL